MKSYFSKTWTSFVLATVVVALVMITGCTASTKESATENPSEDLVMQEEKITTDEEPLLEDETVDDNDIADSEETPTETGESQTQYSETIKGIKDSSQPVVTQEQQEQTAVPEEAPAAEQPIANTPSTSNGKYIVGYYASWGNSAGVPAQSLDGNKLTHINYAFADINSNMELYCPNPTIDLENFAGLRELKSKYPHLKTLISVGGWDYSGKFSDVASTASNRSKFAKSCVEFIVEHGFDGVDLDWEFPVSGGIAGNSNRPEDKENFTKLLQTIREELNTQSQKDGKTYLLTIAGSNGSSYLNKIEATKVASIVDYIFIMGYDIHGPWDSYADFNSPLYNPSESSPQYKLSLNDSINGYLNAGVPANKIVLGMPFYGYKYDTSDGLYSSFDSAISVSRSVIENKYLTDSSYEEYWHSDAMVPYLLSDDAFVSYENEESIEAKVDLAKSNGLAGVGAWELSQDKNEVLLDAAYNALN